MTTFAPPHPREAIAAYLRDLAAKKSPSCPADCGEFESQLREVTAQFRSLAESLQTDKMLRAILANYPDLPALMGDSGQESASAQSDSKQTEQGEMAFMPPLPESVQTNSRLTHGVCPELDWFCHYAERIAYRSFPGFYLTAALELFSTIAAGRPILEVDGSTYRTGLYLAHIADTSLDAKSFLQHNVVERCAEAVGVSFLFGGGGRHTSPEKFLANLTGNRVPDGWEDFSRDEQLWREAVLAFSAQRALYFDEGGEFLEAILGKSSTLAKYADLLLQLYHAPTVFDGSDTLSRGSERVHNACLTLMMSMTFPDIAQHAYAGSKLWAKGFWGRFNFVVADELTEEEIRRRMAKAHHVRACSDPPEMLITSLRAWHKRLGIPHCEVMEEPVKDKTGKVEKVKYSIDREPFPQVSYTLSMDAEDAWLAYAEALQVLCLQLPKDLWGNYGRLPETALRIALIIASLAGEPANCIELKHWAKAQELAETLRTHLHKLYNKVAVPKESFSVQAQNAILGHLEKNSDRWVDSSELQRFCHLSATDVAPILTELVRNEMLQFNPNGGESGRKKLYRAKPGDAA